MYFFLFFLLWFCILIHFLLLSPIQNQNFQRKECQTRFTDYFKFSSVCLSFFMDSIKPQARFTLGKQSSLAPDRDDSVTVANDEADASEAIEPTVRLMYLANEGNLEGIKELLDSGSDVNFRDIDGRTALHVAVCQGHTDVVQLLLERGAEVDPKDRWGSTVILGILLLCLQFDIVLRQYMRFWFVWLHLELYLD